MNFSRLLIPVTGHHRPKYKPVKFCKSICEIYSVYALSCLSLTQSGTNNWFTISLFPQTHIGKFCSTSFLGALFSVAVFLYSTVKSISCYVCSIKMTFYFLYCIQCFKVFPDLFLKQKVGSCDADTLNFSYTSIPSCDLGLNSWLFDTDKDKIQNKYIKWLCIGIYSSNRPSNWSSKGQSQWEHGDHVLIAAIWYLGKGKTKMH